MIENVLLGILILGCIYMGFRVCRWANDIPPSPWER
jgi:hypothetical protein